MIARPKHGEETLPVPWGPLPSPGPFLGVDCAIDRAEQVHQGQLAAVEAVVGHGAACFGSLFCVDEQLVLARSNETAQPDERFERG